MSSSGGESGSVDSLATRFDSESSLGSGLISSSSEFPLSIGRHRVVKLLGEGGFGRVYLAHDDDLDRSVAIKVPRLDRISRPEDVEAYLAEARVLARLDHPAIIPVLDVGRTEDGLCFVVSKYVEGTDLADRLKKGPYHHRDASLLIAEVAEALHHAHTRGLVHRDIKPANILIDPSDRPYVADFGLALKDEDYGKGSGVAGTPAYMSPEQARGEGHRVDGRSDVFSLGVVFYEIMAGKRPFRGDSNRELLDDITAGEIRPLRQLNDLIPRELDRICLKALAKRATDRYPTAKDMADDLRHYLKLAETQSQSQSVTASGFLAAGSTIEMNACPPSISGAEVDPRPIRIVPKGLRAFDEGDADFFLELLPGVRDRDGLPEGLRFWKTRIEVIDPDKTFKVGLIYGPSGCGKSSLVKAGLLPRLARHVHPIYVEATTEETEARLLRGLRKTCPDLPASLGLVETLAAIRRGRVLGHGQKIVLVLDQFEQWLFARKNEEDTQLVAALRQCDGEHIQAIVMVRDDFWLAASRFMRDLEIRLIEGENSALVDLFDFRHATRVLTAFGRAYGALPDDSSTPTAEQKAFLDRSVAGLAQDGKVISVRLALFAEMVKGKPWTPATLKEIGGAEGVGTTFLEETFGPTAPPEHRLHQKASQAVLQLLLPDAGTTIKGHMRSRQELLEASGYVARPEEFDRLLRILDNELRIITPTEPEEFDSLLRILDSELKITPPAQKEAEDQPPVARSSRDQRPDYYQLAHDYLVPSLREWLTRKRKETRRGRAELLLADRAEVWKSRPENRQLPSLLQWLQIVWLTSKRGWTSTQSQMMARASRYHAIRGTIAASLVAVALVVGLVMKSRSEERLNEARADDLVNRVLDADLHQVPGIVAAMTRYRRWTDPRLQQADPVSGGNHRVKLNISLALLPVDSSKVDYLADRLLQARPYEVDVIREALQPHQARVADRLWKTVETPGKVEGSRRLLAASALAIYDPKGSRWDDRVVDAVARDLVAAPAGYLKDWMELLRPIRPKLVPALSLIYRDKGVRESERSLATDILADYAADDPERLVDLLMDADQDQFGKIFDVLRPQAERVSPALTSEIDRVLAEGTTNDLKEKMAKRRANAAVTLLKLGRPSKAWPLLLQAPDPRARSYLIHWFSARGVDPGSIVAQLDREPDITIRRALVLALGEFGENTLSAEVRRPIIVKLQQWFRSENDPGFHAASEWLLRLWGEDSWLKATKESWAKDQAERDRRLEDLARSSAQDGPKSPPRWYVTGQGQTMIAITGPVESRMGSPVTEFSRADSEIPHAKRINRTFAVSAQTVTLEQFLRYTDATKTAYKPQTAFSYTTDLPASSLTWYRAVGYCNWLTDQEGLPESQRCYEIRSPSDVRMRPEYLSLSGYRLPTEAELEYMIRAGTTTARCFGETDELLAKYAWYQHSSQAKVHPVGLKKPNDLGVFDGVGNIWNWTQDAYLETRGTQALTDDTEQDLAFPAGHRRIVRGSSFSGTAMTARSANIMVLVPNIFYFDLGFRVARTIAPAHPPAATAEGAAGRVDGMTASRP